MKKILLLILALTLVLALVSCGECDGHIDENGDGLCDECDEKIEVQPPVNPPADDPPADDPPADDPPAEDPPVEDPDLEIDLPEIKF